MNEIYWPAIIQYDNDPELEYLENAAAWNQVTASSGNPFEQNDRLIDSEGQVFLCSHLSHSNHENLKPAENMPLETLLGLIKAHLADSGSCCVAKAYAPTIRDAIKMIENQECGID